MIEQVTNNKIKTAQTFVPTPPSVEEMRRHEEVQAQVGAARIALRKGRKEDARVSLQRALALNANDAGALETLGDLCLEEGEHEKAIIAFEKGRRLHPHIDAFEEKIGIAKLDLREMQDDAILRQKVLEEGDSDIWQDFPPTRALALSLLLPGAGHFAIDQLERGAMWLGSAVFTFIGWTVPLTLAMKNGGEAVRATGKAFAAWPAAIASMNGGTRFWFWLMMMAWLAIYVLSAIDASRSAVRAREDRRRSIGLAP